MGRRLPIALLLALTLVGQGVALAQSSAALPSAPPAAETGMPCHEQPRDLPSCCEQGASCPDMLVCLTAHAVASSMSVVVPEARDDVIVRLDASLPATSRPPTVFRPPIVISA